MPLPLLPILLLGGLGTGAYFLFRKKDPAKPGRIGPPTKPVKPAVEPEGPAFMLVAVPDSNGTEVGVDVRDAQRMFDWMTTTAAENGAVNDSFAEDVLRSLASSLPGIGKAQVTQVRVMQASTPNVIDWVDVLARYAPMTWGEAGLDIREQMVKRGLG